MQSINSNLSDYKFFCFNGKVGMVYGVTDRNLGKGAKLGIYDSDFNKLEVSRNDEFPQTEVMPKPINYNQMVAIAERISKNFPHVRVDLYNISGKIYFGELTFYDGSGYMEFTPDSFDNDLGDKFDISKFL